MEGRARRRVYDHDVRGIIPATVQRIIYIACHLNVGDFGRSPKQTHKALSHKHALGDYQYPVLSFRHHVPPGFEVGLVFMLPTISHSLDSLSAPKEWAEGLPRMGPCGVPANNPIQYPMSSVMRLSLGPQVLERRCARFGPLSRGFALLRVCTFACSHYKG